MKFVVEKLKPSDIDQALELMSQVISESFKREGMDVNKVKDLLQSEIDSQKQRLTIDPELVFPRFYVAKQEDEIVGVMGYGPIEQTAKDALKKLDQEEKGVIEIFSAYVDFEKQGRGIGSKLLEAILSDLKNTEFQYFSLFTGYKIGKRFWTKKFGQPTIIMKNYFPFNVDCWAWVKGI